MIGDCCADKLVIKLSYVIIKCLGSDMSKKSLVLIGLGILALALYAAGIHTGAYILFGAAVMVEIWFWVKIFRSNKNNRPE